MSDTSMNTNSTPRARRRSSRRVEQPPTPMDASSRVLSAFPWARSLSREERERFGDELAHHPRELSNSGLETLIQSWKLRARQAARAGRRAA